MFTLIVVHRLASLLRFRPLLGKLADYRVRVLVVTPAPRLAPEGGLTHGGEQLLLCCK